MEDINWQKDKTPYIVFSCTKCSQYMYVQEKQKTKKCLRCNKTHKVSNIMNSGEIVYGMTNAVKRVKERQHELANKELGHSPQFTAFGDYRPQLPLKQKKSIQKSKQEENDYILPFKEMLEDLAELYTEAPYYVFDVFADNYNIPQSELKLLMKSSLMQGVLIKDKKSNMYRIKL